MSRVTHINESRCTHEWVMNHVTRINSSFSHVNGSCHTYEWVTLHTWVSNEAWPHVSQYSLMCATWLIYMCDTTHSHVKKTHSCVTWFITHSCMRRDSFICVTRLIHMRKWRIYTCDMNLSCMYHGAFIFAKWLCHHMRNITHSWV